MRFNTRDKKVFVRCSVMLMVDKGYSYEVISDSMGIIPVTFWFGQFDVQGKVVQIEEMTECSLGNEMNETDGGECTIDEGIEKSTFRVGEAIAIALAKLGDEDMGHFLPQKPVKTKRRGYCLKSVQRSVSRYEK